MSRGSRGFIPPLSILFTSLVHTIFQVAQIFELFAYCFSSPHFLPVFELLGLSPPSDFQPGPWYPIEYIPSVFAGTLCFTSSSVCTRCFSRFQLFFLFLSHFPPLSSMSSLVSQPMETTTSHRATHVDFAGTRVLFGLGRASRLPVQRRVARHAKFRREVVGSGVQLGNDNRVFALELASQLLPLGRKRLAVAAVQSQEGKREKRKDTHNMREKKRRTQYKPRAEKGGEGRGKKKKENHRINNQGEPGLREETKF